MRKLYYLTLLLLSGAAPYETVVSLPNIAALQADNFGSRQRVLLSSFGTNVPGGGGVLIQSPSSTADGVLCFADKAANVFCRLPSSVNSSIDANDGGVVTDGVHTNTVATIQNVLHVASVNKIDTVKFCGATLVDPAEVTDISVPAGVRIDLCDSATTVRNGLDYTVAGGLTGILGIPSTVRIVLNSSSGIQHGNLFRYGDSLSPVVFAPVTLRDALNVRAAEAGTGIEIPSSAKAARIYDMSIFGFTTGIDSHGKSLDWNHVNLDATNAVNIDGSGDVTHISDLESVAYLTRGMAERWPIDWLGDNGSGKYEVVAEVLTSDIQWHDGDVGYIGTQIGGGAQSVAGQHTFDCGGGDCAVIPAGTGHCVSPAGFCQVATLVDTSPAPNNIVATWIAGVGIDGHNNPFTVVSGDTSQLSVGQLITTAVTCTPGPVNSSPAQNRIKDIITYEGVMYIYPTLPSACTATAQTITATDDAFVKSRRGVEISPVQRTGTGLNCTNSGGVTVANLHLYTFDLAVHVADGCHQVRLDSPSFGINDPLDEGDITTVLIDGAHDGRDGGDVFMNNCVLGQHTGFALHIVSDNRGTDKFSNCGFGPAAGKKSGTMFEIEAGNVQFVNGGAHVAGNAIIHDGETFTNVYIDNKNDGLHYVLGDVLTVASGFETTCSTYPQYTVDQVDPGTGEILDGHQSRAGVGCTFGADSMPTTGGSGDGSAELVIDGFVQATVQATNVLTPAGDWYEETPYGDGFLGDNNVCGTGICNSKQTFVSNGSNVVFTGLAPGLSGGGSGGSVTGNDTVGRITLGTGPSATFTLTFHTTKANPPICTFTDETTPSNNPMQTLSPSTASVQATSSGVLQAGDNISYSCLAFN